MGGTVCSSLRELKEAKASQVMTSPTGDVESNYAVVRIVLGHLNGRGNRLMEESEEQAREGVGRRSIGQVKI